MDEKQLEEGLNSTDIEFCQLCANLLLHKGSFYIKQSIERVGYHKVDNFNNNTINLISSK